MRARLQPDNDIINGAFRNSNRGLDSVLKQRHRCVSEHAYEETVSRMNRVIATLLGIIFTMTANAEEEKGIIGRVYEDGLPVIYKFVNELPEDTVRSHLSWLTVISWKYDGESNNGMPLNDENKNMIILEDAIEDHIENDQVLRHAYSRTGNNLKELVYYINDQDKFLEAFNKALNGHPRYPIEISFYQDAEWEDFKRLLNDFDKAANK
ncbi:MAG: DUF695 domain-containing protein [Saccharospirillaceae bacterium]|nr:DUF695 domain-containing protein [Saccharospirillaceae bacterium]MCD8530197.1 DUF695 domain-containing protein [Saccharospirillaceae bacterium]